MVKRNMAERSMENLLLSPRRKKLEEPRDAAIYTKISSRHKKKLQELAKEKGGNLANLLEAIAEGKFLIVENDAYDSTS